MAFDGDVNIGHELANEVLNRIAKDLAHVTVYAGRIDLRGRVETLWIRRLCS
jgi:hypothetical protein